jgi:chemotaxis protein methyltransferase CheR
MKFNATTHPLVQDSGFAALKQHLIQSTGLAYYADKDNDLASRISARLAELKLNDCRAYLMLLTNNENGGPERHILVSQLTIGETYFFRHTEQFDGIRDVVLPQIIRRNREQRRLRIWSAGCSIGAEPYTLAILLKSTFAADTEGWDVHILATDINPVFLARAARGEFDENALRGTSEEFKLQWFTRQGRSWIIKSELKEGISFQYHNLVEHPYPSIVHGITALDLIICRNVMIYFDWDHIRKIISQFHECLVPGGWLAVGHAESNPEVFRDFRTIDVPGATLYQKDGNTPARASGTELPWTPPAWAAPSLPPAPRISPPPPYSLKEPKPTGLAHIRQLAEQGKWNEARQGCNDAIRTDGLNASLHFYQALIEEQSGHDADSERALRRAIYLDRNFALAHYHLALLLRKAGNSKGAIQALNNVVKLLSALEGSRPVEDGDGITAEELRQLTEMQLDLLTA